MQTGRNAPTSEASSRQRVRVAVADPFPIVLLGLRKMMEDDRRLEIVAEVSNMPSLLRMVEAEHPAVAVVDWSMAAQDLPATLELMQSASRKLALLFLTSHSDPKEERAIFKLGARNVLNKRATTGELQSAVWSAGQNWKAVEAAAIEASSGIHLDPAAATDPDERIQQLTRRERQLIPLVCGGMRNKAIAAQLGIAESTVWHHLTAVFNKLEVEDRMGLAAFAYGHGLVGPYSNGADSN